MKTIFKKMEKIGPMRPLVVFGKRHIYNLYRRSKLMESGFPSQVWIENTNLCNASCVMCPRDKHTRKQGVMEFSLYEKLIKEISQYKDTVKRIHLHNFGEPLIDKRIHDRVRLAKENGIRHVYLVTNGSLLTPEVSERLIESGLDEMKISFYGTDPKTYNESMVGLDFEDTLRNVRDFFNARKRLGRKNPKVVIQYLPMKTNKSKTEDFLDLMRPFIDATAGDSFNIFSLHNYGDGRSYLKPGTITRICTFPWRVMVILYDGRVTLCSPDYSGLQIAGDVTKDTIKDIWNGESYRKVREAFKKLDYDSYPICKICTAVTEASSDYDD